MLAEMKIRNTPNFNKLDMSGNAGLYGSYEYEFVRAFKNMPT